MGYGALEAKDAIDDRSDMARQILLEELKHRPVLVNRAPTLWKYSINAAKPVLRPGKTIFINTLWENALNSDFDGDCIVNSIAYRVKASSINQNLVLKNRINSSSYIESNTSNTKELDMAFNEVRVRYNYGLMNLRDFPRIEGTGVVTGNKEVFEVPDDLEVLTVRDGVKAWLPVESFHIHKDLTMVEVKTHTNGSIQCSKDHSLVTIDVDLKYIKAEPSVGMVVPRLRESVSRMAEPITEIEVSDVGSVFVPLDKEFGYLNGSFIGDGWINATLRPSDVMLANVSIEVRNEFESCIRSISEGFAKGATVVKSLHTFDGHDCYSEKVSINCRPIADYFRNNIGHGAENKCLPPYWMHSPEEFRWGLLAGLIDTDGTVTLVKAAVKKKSQTQVSYTTTSRTLAFELVALAHSLDLTANCLFSKLTVTGKEAWMVTFNYESIGKMQGRLQLFVGYKAGILAKAVIPQNLNAQKYTPTLSEKRVKELRTAIGYKEVKNPRTKEFKFIGDELSSYRDRNTLYTSVWQSVKKGLPLTKLLATKVFKLDLDLFETSEFWAKWKEMVLDDSIDWEVVKTVTPLPEITEAYDLTIPPAYTMVTEAGFVVYDTMSVHLPVTDKGIEDAKKMMPSELMYSDKKKGDLLYAPTQEPILGLYKATVNLDKPRTGKMHKYNNVKAAWDDYHAGKLKMTDVVEIG